MNLHLKYTQELFSKSLEITGSKSEANRLLILKALYPSIQIENLSNSDDSKVMQQALASDQEVIDIHHAGTAMRFLTSYFALQQGRNTLLTGSERMQQRPMKILVEALKDLGADISYEKQEGFPPLRILGKKITKKNVKLKANVSSQYISSLMLIGSCLQDGLCIELEGKVTSVPYINMTLSLLNEIGVEGAFEDNTIRIAPLKSKLSSSKVVVESDWSSASYFYSIVALTDLPIEIQLSSYKKDSYQGDSSLVSIYEKLGVRTRFEEHSIVLDKDPDFVKTEATFSETLDLSGSPDIAQTIAVTCFGMGLSCHLSGLHTLKIKETDRLVALKTEIEKLGGNVVITNDSLTLDKIETSAIKSNIAIDTYQDHRMAMAFAPLALRTDLIINNANVVSKSYPDFWNDLKALGFQMNS